MAKALLPEPVCEHAVSMDINPKASINYWLIKTYFGHYLLNVSHSKLQVEVIGGADMYMATCRSCFFAPGVVPASPRIPLKTMNNGTKGQLISECLLGVIGFPKKQR